MSPTCHCPTDFPDWHEHDIDLGNHPVHKLKIASFIYMPLSYENYVQQQHNDIQTLELETEWPGFVLTRTGMFRGEIISLLKSGESASRFVHFMPAPFNVRGYLHNGGIGTIKDSTRALQNQLFDLGRMPKDMYLSYLTCPICSDKKGGDKILILRRWQESPTLMKRLKSQR